MCYISICCDFKLWKTTFFIFILAEKMWTYDWWVQSKRQNSFIIWIKCFIFAENQSILKWKDLCSYTCTDISFYFIFFTGNVSFVIGILAQWALWVRALCEWVGVVEILGALRSTRLLRITNINCSRVFSERFSGGPWLLFEALRVSLVVKEFISLSRRIILTRRLGESHVARTVVMKWI